MTIDNNHLHPIKLKYYVIGTDLDTRTAGPVSPYLMGKLHYDTYDVRSATKHSGSICLAVPLLDLGEEVTWTPEMVRWPAETEVHEISAQQIPDDWSCPELSDEQLRKLEASLLRTVLKYYRIYLFRNRYLEFYSTPNESRDEFEKRCLDQLTEDNQSDLDSIRQKYNRQLEQIKHNIQHNFFRFSTDDPSLDILKSKYKTLLFEARENLTKLFLTSDNFPPEADSSPEPSTMAADEYEDMMIRLQHDATREMIHHYERLRYQAADIEDYSFTLSFSDINVDTLAILWEGKSRKQDETN